MGAYTAQILVGQGHPNDGGIINISHMLFLSENSIPSWRLTTFPGEEKDVHKDKEPIVWIPTLEHMLEDALVMIGVYVLKDVEMVAMYNQYIQKTGERKAIALYDDIATERLQDLYKRAREVNGGQKLMISVFNGSTIQRQLKELNNYQLDVEVCVSTFVRGFNMWRNETESRGRLE